MAKVSNKKALLKLIEYVFLVASFLHFLFILGPFIGESNIENKDKYGL
jgi:hypothetical protein